MNFLKNLLLCGGWLLFFTFLISNQSLAQVSCDLTVTVEDNLSEAIEGAGEAAVVCLEPGEHSGSFFVRRGDVTITSLDESDPAIITGGQYVMNIASGNDNIIIDNLIFDSYSSRALVVRGDSHIISNSDFRGNSLDVELNNATNIQITDNILSGGVGYNTSNVSTDVSRFTHKIEGNLFQDRSELFYATDEDNPQIPAGASQIIINNSTNVEVSGLELRNVSVPIQISHSPDAIIDGNDIRDLVNSPLSTLSSGAVSIWQSDGITISNNTVEGVDSRAIFIEGSLRSIVRDNNILSNLEGIGIRESNFAQISNNIIDGTTNTRRNNGNGIDVTSSESVEIIENEITNNEGLGVHDKNITTSINAIIRGNTIRNNGDGGIDWYDSESVTIEGNTVTENSGKAIYSARYSTITDNIITDNTGIGVDTGLNSEVMNNEIRRNSIGINTTAQSSYSNNTITDHSDYGVFLGNVSDDITISENILTGNPVDIRFNSTKEVTLLDNNMETGIYLFSSSQVFEEYDHVIEGNTVSDKPLIYIKNEVAPEIDTNAGQIILLGITDAAFENVSISNVFSGLQILHSENVNTSGLNLEGVGQTSDQNVALVEIIESKNVEVNNSTLSNGKRGFNVLGSDQVKLDANTVRRTEEITQFRGVFAEDSPNLQLTANSVDGLNDGYGITINRNGHGSIIRGNEVFDVEYDALSVTRSDSVNISENKFTRGNSRGIYLSSALAASLSGNTISNFSSHGVESATGTNQSDDVILENNVIRGNTGSGVLLPVQGAELTGNEIEQNNIGAELRDYFLVSDNKILDNTNEGILATGNVTDSNVSDNIISGNGSGISNSGSGTLNAINNWWGDVSGPSGGATDPQTEVVANGSGDTVSENVWFDPWLTENPDSGDDSGDPEPGEATVEFRDLTLSESTIYSGNIVHVQAIADNIGETAGTYQANLVVDGVQVQTAEGYVENPGSDVIQFYYQIDEPGEYQISIEDLPEQTVTVVEGWTQYQFNSDHRSSADFLSGPKTDEVRSLWEVEIDAWMVSSPIVAEGAVYFGSNDNSIYSVSEETGEILWQFQTDNSVRSTPVLYGNILIAGNDDGILFGIDKDTGDEIWRFSTEGEIRANPTVANGVVYFGVFSSTNGQLYALNANDGSDLWSFPTGSSINSTPAISDGVLYFGSNDNIFYALDITQDDLSLEDRLHWSYEGANSFSSTPVVYDEYVYASTGGFGEMDFYAFDKDSGEVLWSKKVENRATSAAVYKDTLYVGSGNAELFAMEYDSGSEIWSTQIEPEFGSISLSNISPVVADGLVYVTTNGNNDSARMLTAMETDNGNERFRFDGLSSTTSPVVINNRAYLGENNRGLIALRETNETDFIPDAELSVVTATSPHWADGQDQSQIDIEVLNSYSYPITGLTNEDFEISAGSAVQSGDVEPQLSDGKYRIYLSNSIAETVEVSVTVKGVELSSKPEVVYNSADSDWNLVDGVLGNEFADVPAVQFLNENKGWLLYTFFGDGVAQDETSILTTDDSGETWSQLFYSNDIFLSDIFFLDEQKGWALDASGEVLITENGGETWEEVLIDDSGDRVTLNSIYFVNDNVGWAGGTKLYNTTDGGQNWTEINLQEDARVQDIEFYDENYGMIAYQSFNETEFGLISTENGGDSWDSEFPAARINGIKLIDENRAYAVGDEGFIFKTDDKGSSWERQNPPVGINFRAVDFTDENNGRVVGFNSTILVTEDGGANWDVEYPGTSEEQMLLDIHFVNESFGWATGSRQTILKYGDATPALALVDQDSSSVTATTPHLADGEDRSTITVQLADSLGEPIDRYNPEDLLINVTGDAQYTAPDVTGNPGEYVFSVSNSVAETVSVSITVDDVQLTDQPEIVFEEPIQLVDADSSTVTATTPHLADGEDQSFVLVQLSDSLGEPIDRFAPGDLTVSVSGSAEATGMDSTGNPGEFGFTVSNTEAETVTVSIIVDDVQLTDQPEIVFEEPIQLVDADSSTVTATSPHLADGEDRSTVIVQLADSLGEPIDRFNPEDLLINVTGEAQYTAPDVTGNPGEYVFSVSNIVAETVSVSITVDDVLLTDQPEILFEEPIQLVDADLSTVTATTPHLADGEDQSFVRIQLSDSLGNPIDRFQPSDIIIDVNGSAEITSPDNLGNPGEFGFTVRNTVVETVTVTITVDDVQLTDQPQIIFQEVETPLPVVNADSSSVSATSPHFADGVDASEVTIVVADSLGEAIGRYTSGDIDIHLNGAGEIGTIESTGDAGIFRASITSLEPGTVSLNVTVDGVVLTDQPEILFEEPIQLVDADLSTVTATTPHDADGVDPSTVVVQLADSLGNPIERFSPADLQIDVSGSAEFTGADNTGNPGEFAFTVTNTIAETVTVSITVDDVQLADQPEILFEEPIQLVDADLSTVTASTPHDADGADPSTVVVQLADSLGNPIERFSPADLQISVSGSAEFTGADNTGNPGEFVFTVTNTVAETVSVSITVDDVLLTNQPEILFEEPFVGVPSAPELTSVEPGEPGANLNWSVSVTDHIDHFLIYRGESPESLTVLESVGPEVRNYLDSNPLQGASVYALTAVNRNGEESELSNIIYYINSEIVASTEWQLSSTPLSVESDEMDLATIYSYSDRYDLSSTFIPGRGYWIKTKSFDNETIPAAGQGLDSLSVRLNPGWNLIGSLSEPVSIFAISDPEELLTETPVYLYKDGNYAATDELIPNSGHWIYAREDGNITITVQNDPPTAGMELADSETDSELNQELARIQFISGSSSSELVASQVYLSEAEQQSYLLPPVAPDPVLDVRSENHSKLINNEPTEIQINSKHYPIEIKIEGLEENSPYAYRIYAEKKGVSRTIDLISGNSEILDQEYDHLEIEMIYADEVVTENQLLPNYPNPFNPSTTIQYQLREQTHVMIEVYDVIGRRIQLLANETQLSGEHRVNFDGTNLSSGLYFIRFQAGNVVDIRKMTLIK